MKTKNKVKKVIVPIEVSAKGDVKTGYGFYPVDDIVKNATKGKKTKKAKKTKKVRK